MRKKFYHAYNPAPKGIWGNRTLQRQRESIVAKWSESGLLDGLRDNHQSIDVCDAMMMCTFMNFREEYLNKPKS